MEKFKGSDKFLFSAFSQFSVKDTLDFLHNHNVETKVEALGRVFPITNESRTIWDALVAYTKQGNVTVLSDMPVIGLETFENKVVDVLLKGNKKIRANSFVLSTGGMSRPETGSTGDGFNFLKEIGHKVIEPSSSLVPMNIKEEWVKKIPGLSLSGAKVTLLQNSVKQSTKTGKMLFTHFGLSGPAILNLSHDASELLKYGEVQLSLDILPHLDYGQLNAKLQEIFKQDSNKKVRNSLSTLIPSGLVPAILDGAEINADTPSHSVTREERLALVKQLKETTMTVDSLLGVEKAIITSGGVSLEEIDFKTMSSKLFENLFIIGDLLNIDRPSGGYSLQLCWTTGFVAGTNA